MILRERLLSQAMTNLQAAAKGNYANLPQEVDQLVDQLKADQSRPEDFYTLLDYMLVTKPSKATKPQDQFVQDLLESLSKNDYVYYDSKNEKAKIQKRYQKKAKIGLVVDEDKNVKAARFEFADKDLDEVTELAEKGNAAALDALIARVNDGSNAARVNLASLYVESIYYPNRVKNPRAVKAIGAANPDAAAIEADNEKFRNFARNYLREVLFGNANGQALSDINASQISSTVQVHAFINWVYLELHDNKIHGVAAQAKVHALNEQLKASNQISKEAKSMLQDFEQALAPLEAEYHREVISKLPGAASVNKSINGESTVADDLSEEYVEDDSEEASTLASDSSERTDLSERSSAGAVAAVAANVVVPAPAGSSQLQLRDKSKPQGFRHSNALLKRLKTVELPQDEVDVKFVKRSKLLITLGFTLGAVLVVAAGIVALAIFVATHGIALAAVPAVGATLASWSWSVTAFGWLTALGANIATLSPIAATLAYVASGVAAGIGVVFGSLATAEAIKPGAVSSVFGNVPGDLEPLAVRPAAAESPSANGSAPKSDANVRKEVASEPSTSAASAPPSTSSGAPVASASSPDRSAVSSVPASTTAEAGVGSAGQTVTPAAAVEEKALKEGREKPAGDAEAKRLAEEEATKKRLAEEEAAKKRLAEEEAAKKRLAEEEATKKRLAEEEAAKKRLAEEEATKKRLAEEEAAKKRLAEEEAAKKRLAEEEAARKKAEEDQRKREEREEADREADAMLKQLDEENQAADDDEDNDPLTGEIPVTHVPASQAAATAAATGSPIHSGDETKTTPKKPAGRPVVLPTSPAEATPDATPNAKSVSVKPGALPDAPAETTPPSSPRPGGN